MFSVLEKELLSFASCALFSLGYVNDAELYIITITKHILHIRQIVVRLDWKQYEDQKVRRIHLFQRELLLLREWKIIVKGSTNPRYAIQHFFIFIVNIHWMILVRRV